MKKPIFWIVCFLSFFQGTGAIASDTFTFDSAGPLPGYTIEMTGPFTEPDAIQAGNVVIGYSAKHKQYPSAVFSGGQYLFLGRTGEKTFQLEARNSDTETKTVVNCYLDPNEPLNLDRLLFGYLPYPTKNKFKLRLIALKGNSLVCQVIIPDAWKVYFSK